MEHRIDIRSVGQIRAAFSNGRHAQIAPIMKGAPVSLAAALEIATWLEDETQIDTLARQQFEELESRCATITMARKLLREQGAIDERINLNSGVLELSTITELTVADRRWNEYFERFTIAMKNAGFHRGYADALGYALHEMADNVIRHAGAVSENGNRPRSLAGWNVAGDTAAFAVVDLGQGVRHSLMQNPRWKYLTSDQEALNKAVREHATRIVQNEFGEGYQTILKNFADRNGCVSIRSGLAEIFFVSDGITADYTTRPYPLFRGTRVALWCAPGSGAPPAEPDVSKTT